MYYKYGANSEKVFKIKRQKNNKRGIFVLLVLFVFSVCMQVLSVLLQLSRNIFFLFGQICLAKTQGIVAKSRETCAITHKIKHLCKVILVVMASDCQFVWWLFIFLLTLSGFSRVSYFYLSLWQFFVNFFFKIILEYKFNFWAIIPYIFFYLLNLSSLIN